jgi:cytoskeletal protein RodZ
MSYIIAIIVLLLAGLAFTGFQARNTTPAAPTPVVEQNKVPVEATPTTPTETKTNPTNTTTAPSTETPSTKTTYKNGTYEATVTYVVPNRKTYSMDVSLTLTDDVITTAAVSYGDGAEKDPNAQRFDAAYKSLVIGQKLDAIQLSRVGGASLTTNAFNEAAGTIKTKAS